MTEEEEKALFLAVAEGDEEIAELQRLLGVAPEVAAEAARLFYHAFMVSKDKNDDAQGS